MGYQGQCATGLQVSLTHSLRDFDFLIFTGPPFHQVMTCRSDMERDFDFVGTANGETPLEGTTSWGLRVQLTVSK